MATDVFPGAQLIQLVEFGYPMGVRRPAPDPALAYSVVHITANLASAENEAAWRLNDPALQNSATFFLNQNGGAIQCLGDPLHMDPWTNGDVNRPNLANPRIAHMVSSGVNANERSLLTIENVGREPGAPITPAQEAKCAAIIAYYHAKAGVPVNRQTVIGHYELNSVDRANCPSTNKSILDRIVALASGGTGDVNLKGTNFVPRNHLTTITTAAGHTEDPTAQPYNNLRVLPAGTAFKVDWIVQARELAGTDVWYGGWVFTNPPQFGYVISANCGPLSPITQPAPSAPAGPTPREAADAVATAAIRKAAEF